MPSTAANASGTAAGSITEASSKSHTPSGNSSARAAGDLERQPSLTDAAHPRQRQPSGVSAPRIRVRSTSSCAADQAGDRRPQIPRTRIRVSATAGSPSASRGAAAEQIAIGLRYIAQPPRAQVHQGRHRVSRRRRRVGQQDLAAVPGGHHPGGPIERRCRSNRRPAARPRPSPRPIRTGSFSSALRVDRGIHGGPAARRTRRTHHRRCA